MTQQQNTPNQGGEHILVVDDDDALRNLLQRYLSQNGYRVTTVHDGRAMDAALAQTPVDLLILDLMLPGEDGLSLARRISLTRTLPILMLSARGEDVDRIVGLEMGADDYLAKPFNPRELLARVRALLRRKQQESTPRESQAPSEQLFLIGPYQFDLQRHTLSRGGEVLQLTAGEVSLLEVFVRQPGKVLSRDELHQRLRGFEQAPFDRSIDVRVTRLRRKLEPDPAKPIYLRTVWGKGYLFTPDGNNPC